MTSIPPRSRSGPAPRDVDDEVPVRGGTSSPGRTVRRSMPWAEWSQRKSQQQRDERAREVAESRREEEEARATAEASRDAMRSWSRQQRIREAKRALFRLHVSGAPAMGGTRGGAEQPQSRALDDTQWKQVAAVLQRIQRGALGEALYADADPVTHLGELGDAWLAWTRASGKAFQRVALPPVLAQKMGVTDADGNASNVIPTLVYTRPEPASVATGRGGPAIQMRQLPERQRAANTVYDMLCRQVWKRVEAGDESVALPAGESPIALLHRWADEDEERHRVAKQQQEAAGLEEARRHREAYERRLRSQQVAFPRPLAAAVTQRATGGGGDDGGEGAAAAEGVLREAQLEGQPRGTAVAPTDAARSRALFRTLLRRWRERRDARMRRALQASARFTRWQERKAVAASARQCLDALHTRRRACDTTALAVGRALAAADRGAGKEWVSWLRPITLWRCPGTGTLRAGSTALQCSSPLAQRWCAPCALLELGTHEGVAAAACVAAAEPHPSSPSSSSSSSSVPLSGSFRGRSHLRAPLYVRRTLTDEAAQGMWNRLFSCARLPGGYDQDRLTRLRARATAERRAAEAMRAAGEARAASDAEQMGREASAEARALGDVDEIVFDPSSVAGGTYGGPPTIRAVQAGSAAHTAFLAASLRRGDAVLFDGAGATTAVGAGPAPDDPAAAEDVAPPRGSRARPSWREVAAIAMHRGVCGSVLLRRHPSLASRGGGALTFRLYHLPAEEAEAAARGKAREVDAQWVPLAELTGRVVYRPSQEELAGAGRTAVEGDRAAGQWTLRRPSGRGAATAILTDEGEGEVGAGAASLGEQGAPAGSTAAQGVLFRVPPPDPAGALAVLRRWVEEDAELHQSDEQRAARIAVDARARAEAAHHADVVRQARAAVRGLDAARADTPGSWLRVGALLRSVSPALLSVWTAWTLQCPRWEALARQGFRGGDMEALCAAQWAAMAGSPAPGGEKEGTEGEPQPMGVFAAASEGSPRKDKQDAATTARNARATALAQALGLSDCQVILDSPAKALRELQDMAGADAARREAAFVAAPRVELQEASADSLRVAWAPERVGPASAQPSTEQREWRYCLEGRPVDTGTGEGQGGWEVLYQGHDTRGCIRGLQPNTGYHLRVRCTGRGAPRGSGERTLFTLPKQPTALRAARIRIVGALAEVVLRWSGGLCPPGTPRRYFLEGRVIGRASAVRERLRRRAALLRSGRVEADGGGGDTAAVTAACNDAAEDVVADLSGVHSADVLAVVTDDEEEDEGREDEMDGGSRGLHRGGKGRDAVRQAPHSEAGSATGRGGEQPMRDHWLAPSAPFAAPKRARLPTGNHVLTGGRSGGAQPPTVAPEPGPRGCGRWHWLFWGGEATSRVAPLRPNCCYEFRVREFNAAGECSSPTPVLRVQTPLVATARPSALSGGTGDDHAAVQWGTAPREAVYRGRLRALDAQRHAAARAIQRAVRAWLLALKLRMLALWARQQRAARVLQCAVRQWRARRCVRALRSAEAASEWVRHVDPTTGGGQPYYYSMGTGRRVWALSEGEGGAGPDAALSDPAATVVRTTVSARSRAGGEGAVALRRAWEEDAPRSAGAVPPPVMRAWLEYWDPTWQRCYLYNPLTGKSQWVFPRDSTAYHLRHRAPSVDSSGSSASGSGAEGADASAGPRLHAAVAADRSAQRRSGAGMDRGELLAASRAVRSAMEEQDGRLQWLEQRVSALRAAAAEAVHYELRVRVGPVCPRTSGRRGTEGEGGGPESAGEVGAWQLVYRGSLRGFQLRSLPPHTYVRCCVRAVDRWTGGRSAWSKEMRLCTAPAPPTRVTVCDGPNAMLHVNWMEPVNGAHSYVVETACLTREGALTGRRTLYEGRLRRAKARRRDFGTVVVVTAKSADGTASRGCVAAAT